MIRHSRQFGIWSNFKKSIKDEINKDKELKSSINELKSNHFDKVKNAAAKSAQNFSEKSTQNAQELSEKAKNWSEKAKNLSEKASEKAQHFSGKASKTSRDFYKENMEKSTQEASERMHKAYQESKQNAEESSIWKDMQSNYGSARLKMTNFRRKFVQDDLIQRFRIGLKETSDELFYGGDKKRDIDSTLTFKTHSVNSKEHSEETSEKKPGEEYAGPNAIVKVKDAGSAWERISKRLRETPIIQGMLDAAKLAAKTKAGKTINKGARVAKDKIGDASEDAREFWETSQHPWVYRLSSLYDGFFGETEMGVTIREIRRADPNFVMEKWKDDMEEVVLPAVLSSFLKGESMKLKKWFGEAAYNTVNYAIRERKADGLVVDSNVLAISNVEVLAAEASDRQSPMIVLQCMAQQIHCIKNREGEIIEGGEDQVRAVFYVLAFKRDYDDEKNVLQWKIAEFAIGHSEPYV